METTRDRILQFIAYKGDNKKQFYEKTGLSNGFLDKTANPGADKLDKILTAYPDANLVWLVSGRDDMIIAPNIAPIIAPNDEKTDLQLVPKAIVIDRNERELVILVPVKAAAGYLNGYADPEYIGTLPTIDIPGISGQTHRAFENRGSSMLPNHHSGSISICRWVESLNDIRDRRVYVIVTKQDGIVLKRVLNRIKQDGKLVLMSDNDNKREYPNYTIDPEDVLEIWYWRAGVIRETPEPGTVYSRLNDMEARLSLIEGRLNSH